MTKKPIAITFIGIAILVLFAVVLWPRHGWCLRCGRRMRVIGVHVFQAGPVSDLVAMGGPGSAYQYCGIHGHVGTVAQSKAGILHDWEYQRDAYDTEDDWHAGLKNRSDNQETQ